MVIRLIQFSLALYIYLDETEAVTLSVWCVDVSKCFGSIYFKPTV